MTGGVGEKDERWDSGSPGLIRRQNFLSWQIRVSRFRA